MNRSLPFKKWSWCTTFRRVWSRTTLSLVALLSSRVRLHRPVRISHSCTTLILINLNGWVARNGQTKHLNMWYAICYDMIWFLTWATKTLNRTVAHVICNGQRGHLTVPLQYDMVWYVWNEQPKPTNKKRNWTLNRKLMAYNFRHVQIWSKALLQKFSTFKIQVTNFNTNTKIQPKEV